MALHSPEFREKRRKRKRLRTIIVVSSLIVLMGASIYVAHVDRLSITNVQVLGNRVTSDEEIRKIAEQELAGKYVWLYPRRNILIYPKGAIRSALLAEIPRLKGAELKVGSQVLEIKVEERSPFAMYCENIEVLSDPTECYFLDEDGLIFARAPEFSGEVYFLFTSDVAMADPQGKNFLPPREFRRVSELVAGLGELDVRTRAFRLVPAEEEYRLILSNLGYIVWNSYEKLDKIASNLETFLLDESVASQTDFFDRVQYIDLRYEDKVFYRFQDEEEEVEEEEVIQEVREVQEIQ